MNIVYWLKLGLPVVSEWVLWKVTHVICAGNTRGSAESSLWEEIQILPITAEILFTSGYRGKRKTDCDHRWQTTDRLWTTGWVHHHFQRSWATGSVQISYSSGATADSKKLAQYLMRNLYRTSFPLTFHRDFQGNRIMHPSVVKISKWHKGHNLSCLLAVYRLT